MQLVHILLRNAFVSLSFTPLSKNDGSIYFLSKPNKNAQMCVKLMPLSEAAAADRVCLVVIKLLPLAGTRYLAILHGARVGTIP